MQPKVKITHHISPRGIVYHTYIQIKEDDVVDTHLITYHLCEDDQYQPFGLRSLFVAIRLANGTRECIEVPFHLLCHGENLTLEIEYNKSISSIASHVDSMLNEGNILDSDTFNFADCLAEQLKAVLNDRHDFV